MRATVPARGSAGRSRRCPRRRSAVVAEIRFVERDVSAVGRPGEAADAGPDLAESVGRRRSRSSASTCSRISATFVQSGDRSGRCRQTFVDSRPRAAEVGARLPRRRSSCRRCWPRSGRGGRTRCANRRGPLRVEILTAAGRDLWRARSCRRECDSDEERSGESFTNPNLRPIRLRSVNDSEGLCGQLSPLGNSDPTCESGLHEPRRIGVVLALVATGAVAARLPTSSSEASPQRRPWTHRLVSVRRARRPWDVQRPGSLRRGRRRDAHAQVSARQAAAGHTPHRRVEER